MPALKTNFVCQNCGNKSTKWIGKCPSCNEWNTFVEEVESTGKKKSNNKKKDSVKPISINLVEKGAKKRVSTNLAEVDRVLGGGLVKGSIVLFGGEPGIGKSTILLQIALKLESNVLYISGEESAEQIKLRADRLQSTQNPNCYIYCNNSLEDIISEIKEIQPELVIVDSIQTLYSEKLDSIPSSISQIRECTYELANISKYYNIPILLVGHINKEGALAGPKVLEHMVDVVLLFEGDKDFLYRILRAQKNRFGSTAEIGIFEMKEEGLVEIKDTARILLNKYESNLSGTSYGISLEGYRPFMLEVQALVSSAVYGNPQRVSNGFDLKRLSMLLAVLEKRANFKLTIKDVFVNLAGGFKLNDTALDLPLLVAVLSSDLNLTIKENTCFCGEIGLSGEIRPVSRIEERIKEAQKLGFQEIVISGYHNNLSKQLNSLQITRVKTVKDLVKELF